MQQIVIELQITGSVQDVWAINLEAVLLFIYFFSSFLPSVKSILSGVLLNESKNSSNKWATLEIWKKKTNKNKQKNPLTIGLRLTITTFFNSFRRPWSAPGCSSVMVVRRLLIFTIRLPIEWQLCRWIEGWCRCRTGLQPSWLRGKARES